jgi:hypothetical protein
MRLLGFYVLAVAAASLASQALAQSGVLSGPPQVRGGAGPSQGPGPGPNLESSPGPATGIDPQPGGAWVAVAGGFREGRWVRVGFARRNTRGEAEISAIEACNGGPGGVRCTNPFATSGGCLYIVAGTRRGGVTWGRGSSREAALSECRRGGYTCKEKDIIGGCADR